MCHDTAPCMQLAYFRDILSSVDLLISILELEFMLQNFAKMPS